MPDLESLDVVKTALASRYRVLREVGRGGFGIVFQAEHQGLGRTVAVKVVRRELVDAVGAERVLRELALSARLSHPHILPILDSGLAAGVLYYVMPYLTAETLRARIDRERRLPLDDVLQIGHDVADALSYAHAHNVLHRDINPANVFVESRRAVVKDFWIARALASTDRERLQGVALGTLAYMSPEQMALSPDIGPRSDVYSLACLMFEMLTGAPPFGGPWAAPVVARHAHGEPRLDQVRPDVTPAADRVIRDALAKTPGERPSSPDELVQALERALPLPLPMAARARKGPIVPWLLAGAAVLAAVGLGFIGLRPGVPTAALRTTVWLLAILVAALGGAIVVAWLTRISHRRATANMKTPGDPEARIRSSLRYRYEVDHELGRGGMGVVYLAHDLRYPGRTVALKVLRSELAASVESERFLLEIEIAAQLTHPAIVPLFDSGDVDGRPFYVMPYLEGESLRDRIVREGRLPIQDVKDIVRNVAGALDYAHRKGVVHRDVKPDNILICGGLASIMDFGIALALDSARKRLTAKGFSPGTLEYMSPEQLWDPQSIDHRTDLYSLACVMFEMLAGQPPYTGAPQTVAAQHLNAPVPRVRSVRSDVPEAMDAVIFRLLSKNKTERFESGAALAAALA